ncbi:TPA: hypothetical protein QCH64_002740 [Enterobacter asburiae]|uniref:antitermination protein Q n=1 Tax=Enterobacter asburiae TaxID=61645 RepID=UPI001A24F72A|nr:antitermination protein [Enterobacter asburiae]MCS0625309.1 hypothetical protein [Enterobacter asburiae]HAT7488647.1 antitermination protein [Enterobacter asburiae]HAT7510207.1 antitermination protein [Enterobacter asburiae]HDR2364443.1 hypothetical protein [Enterobacter asburiae]
MRLKYAITIGDPKSAQIVELQARSTGNSHLTRDDIVVSLGLTQSRCRAGLSLIYAKYTKDSHAAQTALSALRKYAASVYKKYIPKNGDPTIEAAVSVLAMLALEEFCRTADTPGAKCRCGGKGEVRDLKNSRMKGRPIQIPCPRCHGTGLRPMTRSRCHHAILKFCSVSQSTFSRYWNPFYDDLLNWCLRQESLAEDSYNFITNLNPSSRESSG